MNEAVAKKTQDTLGKVIKKPPLTEKLLSKPPFRYLHDIFSEVIRTTGFMKGLYGEAEMKPDNVKDKDSKIAFLQKAIDVVMLVSGEPLSVKPARVVAGHEPEKTNELLQAIGRCCLSKLPSDDAVRRILSGDKSDLKGRPMASKSRDKENRERLQDREERREIRERSSSRDRKNPDLPKEQESKQAEKDRNRDRERTNVREREKDKSRDRVRERDKDKDKSRARDKDRERDRDKDREPPKEKDGDRDKRRERDKERDKEGRRRKEPEEKAKEPEKVEKKTRSPEETRNRKPPEDLIKNDNKPCPEEPAEVSETQPDGPSRIPRPSSAKGQRRRPKPAGQDESDSDGGGETLSAEPPAHMENGGVKESVPPRSTLRRIPRPSSARPAPPRAKRQESYSEVVPGERLGSAKPSSAVIVEGKKLSEDEDDEDAQFVVNEAVLPTPDMPQLEVEPAAELKGDEKHGGLVKKILETKKDYETSPMSPKSSDRDRSLVSEAARKKERDLVSREMERLRSSIQTVCRSALPLGKIMDYIQEDMDSMQNELLTWRRENQEHAQALLQEQRITDSAVEPLQAELVELDQLIRDQQDKICAIKFNILNNEEKIQRMVSSVSFSSRT